MLQIPFIWDYELTIHCSGGKGQAPLISDDADWRTILAQLQISVNRPRSKLDTVCVIFDLDQMEGFKNCRHVMFVVFIYINALDSEFC